MAKNYRIGIHISLLSLFIVLPLLLCFPSPIFAADEYRYFDGDEHEYFTTGNYRIYDGGFILSDIEVIYDSCDNFGFNTNAWKDGNDGYMKVSGTVTEPVTCAFEANLNLMAAPDVTVRFVVTIDNVNENPTNITLSSKNIDENRPSGTIVGTLGYTDPDVEEGYGGGTYTFSIISGDTDSFTITGNSLFTNAVFNYENEDSYRIGIRVRDPSGLTYSETYTISINNVNETPTNISLSSSSVAENVAVNSVVGTLTSTDPDAANTFTYTLVSGTGSTDNASFNISGGNLRTSFVFDHETKSSYAIRLRSTDQGGLWTEKQFSITVTNVNETVAVAVSSSSPTVTGQAYNVSVTVSPASGAGTPTGSVTISDGAGASCNAVLSGGAGSCSLTSTSAGTKTLTGNYGGDSNWNSASDTTTHVVNKASTASQITAVSSASTVYGEDYTVTASVAAVAPGAGTAGGTITISDNDSNTCTITLAGGTGSCDIASTAVGTKTLTASYNGDANYQTSTDTESHTVLIASSATSISTVVPSPSHPGEIVTMTVDVDPVAPSGGVPSGSVEIREGATLICSVTLTNGSGSCTSSGFAGGAHTLNAAYGGEAGRYTGSVSANVTHKVQQIALSDNKVSTSFTDVGLLTTSGGSAPYVYQLKNSGNTCTAGNSSGNSGFTISANTLQRTPASVAGSYSVCVESTDDDGSAIQNAFTVIINAPPVLTDASLDKKTVGDTQEQVGTLTPTGGQDPQVFSLKTSGSACTAENGAHNGRFTMDGEALKRNADTPVGTYQVCIQVEDAEGETAQWAYTITVTSPPKDLTLSGHYISTSQTVVGQFALQDGQAPVTYSLATGGGTCTGVNGAHNAYFSINGSDLQRQPATGAGTYSICAQGEDANGMATQKVFSIIVTNPPSNLNLSNSQVLTTQTAVGALSTTDGQYLYTYSLQSSGTVCNGSNSADNGQFEIDGNALKRKSGTAAGIYNNVCLQTTDANGESLQKVFSIIVAHEAPSALEWEIQLTSSQLIDGDVSGTLTGTMISSIEGTLFSLADMSKFPDSAYFDLTPEGALTVNTAVDYSLKRYYTIRILAEEPQGDQKYLDAIITVMQDGAAAGAMAISDGAAMMANQTVTIEVLTNDMLSTGASGWASHQIVRYPRHGDAHIGSIVYTPYPNWYGRDDLSYRACDDLGFCVLAEVTIDVSPLPAPATGFAPGVITLLPAQDAQSAYSIFEGELLISIPRISANARIVGVPTNERGWDITWLGTDVGWLKGSAAPTWNGNSVLTGHVYDANGQPGVFSSLDQLMWGDDIIISMSGSQYVFEVREVLPKVTPDDMETMFMHKDEPWLTLVTCQGFDAESSSYDWRYIVRAVLVRTR